jgi:hypothetical protein
MKIQQLREVIFRDLKDERDLPQRREKSSAFAADFSATAVVNAGYWGKAAVAQHLQENRTS